MRIQFVLWATVLMLCPLACARIPEPAELARKAAVDEARSRRKQALDRAYALGKRFQTFGNRLNAARAMSILGQTVCQYDHA